MTRQFLPFTTLAALLLTPTLTLAAPASPTETPPAETTNPDPVIAPVDITPPTREPIAPDGPSRMVHVDVDVSALEPALGSRLQFPITEAVEDQLIDAGFTVIVSSGAEATVRVHVRVKPEVPMTYELEYDLVIGGEPHPTLASARCPACSEAEVATIAGRELGPVIAALREHETVDDEPAPAPEALPCEPAPVNIEHGPKRPALFGPVAIAGLAVAGAGVVSLVAGGAVFAMPDRAQTFPDSSKIIINYDQPGVAWMGVGAAAIVVGGAAVLVDMLALRPARARRLAVGADVSLNRVGLQIRGRF